jgi:dihydrofolate synthase/folylpolyglutamate synthase
MVDSIEKFLNSLHHPTLAAVDLKLDRMIRMLALFGNPQRRLPPIIHVAGTNGKGSLIAYLKAIFEAAGKRAHVYTSPHLVHFRERIVIAGKMIENSYIENLIRHMTPIMQQQPATFFEATTALAFLAFAEKPADILLLETGVGGRLDATNVIEKPLLTAITPISYDHMEYLGDTLTKIAFEKAGIMKKNVPCVIGRHQEEAMAVLEKCAAELNVAIHRMDSRGLAIKPSLVGSHQFDNAATAVKCIDLLPQFGITDEHILQGIANAVWPARLQKITDLHYRMHLPDTISLWLDGGHNTQGGEILGAWLAERPEQEKYIICGMVQGKDSAGFLSRLAPHVKAAYTLSIPDESTAQTGEAVAQSALSVGLEALVTPNIEIALQTIAQRAKTPALICICGSLYLAGKVLAGMEQ